MKRGSTFWIRGAQVVKEKLNIAMLGHKRIPLREGGIEDCGGETLHTDGEIWTSGYMF